MSGNKVVPYFDNVLDQDKESVIILISDVLNDEEMDVSKKHKLLAIKHTIISSTTGKEEVEVYYKDGILNFIELFMKLYSHHKLIAILNDIFNKAFLVAQYALIELRKLKDIIENGEKSYDDNELHIIQSNYENEVIGVLNNINGPEIKIMEIFKKDQDELADSIEDIKKSIIEREIRINNPILFNYIRNIKELSAIYYNEKEHIYTYIKDVESLINMIGKSLIILNKIYLFFKDIEKKVSQIEYERENAKQQQPGGFRKKNNLKPTVVQSKEILGKIRRIYKVAGSRKEHIKYKGELISVSDYKKLVSQAKALKSQNKPVTKPKAKPVTKPATKPNTKSATKPKPATKSATKPKAKPATKPASKSATKPASKSAPKPRLSR